MFIQVIGSSLVLLAFILSQYQVIDTKRKLYLWLNFLGSAILASDALLLKQWGFLALEGVWAIVSFVGLIKLAIINNRYS